METQVLISGGGIAGLTLALKLVSQGVSVVVVEKDEHQSILYKGELLQPKSLEILAELGVLDDVLHNGQRIHRTTIIERNLHPSTVTSELQQQSFSMEYGVLPKPYQYAVMIPHDCLKMLILKKAEATGLLSLIRPAQIAEWREQRALIQTENGILEINASFMIGAEGKFSVSRERQAIPVKKQTYNHQFLTVTIDRPDSLKEATVISEGNRMIGLFPLPNQQVRTVLLLRKGEFREMKRTGIRAFHQAYHRLAPELEGYVDKLERWKDIQLMIPLRQEAKRYFQGNYALLGDAAHSVHPMAGEGMNMAIQDADVLGSLMAWMFQTGRTEETLLGWYERVRKPRAQFVASISHLSALAYSFPFAAAHALRARVLANIAHNEYLLRQYMTNISGLGMAKETLFDRALQLGLWPSSGGATFLRSPTIWFSERTDYPWLYS